MGAVKEFIAYADEAAHNETAATHTANCARYRATVVRALFASELFVLNARPLTRNTPDYYARIQRRINARHRDNSRRDLTILRSYGTTQDVCVCVRTTVRVQYKLALGERERETISSFARATR